LQNNLSIHSIACGGLHTLALTTNGRVFSWGCNDSKVLGRQSNARESVPDLVAIDLPINLISAGDSHSIACNTANSVVYM
jgi:regulator of chromosome condensation